MKRSPPPRRKAPLDRTGSPRTRAALGRGKGLARAGKRAAGQLDALEAFRAGVIALAARRVGKGRCERCLQKRVLDSHHRLPRARGGLHNLSNGAALCRRCHDTIHFGLASDESRWLVSTKPGRA